MRQLWRWVPWACVVAVGGCGYSASPVELVIDTLARDTSAFATLTALGIVDPAASEFGDGAMISTRWSSQRETARTVELNIDLDLGGLPANVRTSEEAIELEGSSIAITVVQRRLDGTVAETVAPVNARVAVVARSSEAARELSAGRFQMTMPDEDDVAYLHIQGTWRTIPPPAEVVEVREYPPGDFMTPGGDPGPGDAGAGDQPGDPGPGDAGVIVGDPGSHGPKKVVFASGCSCPGGDYDETLPREEEPEPEPQPEDTGGCDCIGDRGADEEPAEPEEIIREEVGCSCIGDPGTTEEEEEEPTQVSDPSPSETQEDAGCDCVGDPGAEEEESPAARTDTDTDTTTDSTLSGCAGADNSDDDSSSSESETTSGCSDCASSEDDSNGGEVGAFSGQLAFASLAAAPSPQRMAQHKARRARCRRSPLRVGLELSPVVGLFVLSRWRRRRR